MPATNITRRSRDQSNRSGSIVSIGQEQMSATHYRFRMEGTRMYGVRVASPVSSYSESPLRSIDGALRAESAIWDNLSDEALLNFEDSIA